MHIASGSKHAVRSHPAGRTCGGAIAIAIVIHKFECISNNKQARSWDCLLMTAVDSACYISMYKTRSDLRSDAGAYSS